MLGRFLVVEPDPATADMLAGVCRDFRATELARDIPEAWQIVASSRRLVALITEADLPSGNGLELVKAARKERPLLPILVLTGRADPRLINRAHGLRAEYHCKPTHRSALHGFLRRAVAFERVADQRIAWAVDEMTRRNGLTLREVDLLTSAIAGVPRRALADELGVSENTLKTRTRSLLRKCSAATLEEVARATLHLAISSSEPCATLPPPSEPPEGGPPSILPSGRRHITASEEELEALRALMRAR